MLMASVPRRTKPENMNLSALVSRLEEEDQLISIRKEDPNLHINNLKSDSRAVEEGDLFFAWKGTEQDGHEFLSDALEHGAAAVVCEKPPEINTGSAPVLLVKNGRISIGHCADRFYDEPSRDLSVVGVTGTNGKTTVTTLIHHLFEGVAGTAGLMNTIHTAYGERVIPSEITTPGPEKIHSLLDQMRSAGCEYAVTEVSSHALDQHRTSGVRFAAGVFTNLSRDHLDYHGDMASYARAKARLFERIDESGVGVINEDDPRADMMKEHCAGRICTYGLEHRSGDVTGEVVHQSTDGTTWKLRANGETVDVEWDLVGKHNIYNALAGVALVRSMTEVDLEELGNVLASFQPVDGRLDPVKWNGSFSVFVDYAHTPDALENVLESIRPVTEGKVRAVFGCGGDRDRGKRPIMGSAVEAGADVPYVTSDNPRTEDPEAIIKDILEGISNPDVARVEPDREQAIRLAVEEAEPGDVVLILGRGHETMQKIDGTTRPFKDEEVAENWLNKLYSQNP